MSTPELEFRPRPLSRRTWIGLGIVAICVGILYAIVAYFYNTEGCELRDENFGRHRSANQLDLPFCARCISITNIGSVCTVLRWVVRRIPCSNTQRVFPGYRK